MSSVAKPGIESMVEGRWRHILGGVNESIAILARSSEMYYFNHNDKMPFDLVGRLTTEFLVADDHDEYLRALGTVFDSGETIEYVYSDVTGQSWRSRMSPLSDNQGNVEAVLAVGVQVDAEGDSGLRIRELQMRTAVDTTGMGLWSLDLMSNKIVLDPRSCELHGLSTEESRGLSIEDFVELVSVDDRQKLRNAFEPEVLRAVESTLEELEYQFVDSQGAARWISCRGSVIRDVMGQAHCAVGAFFDISDRKLLQEQLLLAQKMEAVGQLTAGIAHNFNNILSAILPNLDLAKKHVDADGAKFVRNARLAADRASDLVNELMVVAGRKEGEKRQRLDLYDVAERVIRICRTTFGGWVKLVFEERARASVVANQSQVEQVLLNLLLNARDAFEEGTTSSPHIHITLDRVREDGADFALIRVCDNGPGMKASVLERAFEPFFTTKGKGTGLGLATAFAIVRDHGGHLRCESRLGETLFEVLLPVDAHNT